MKGVLSGYIFNGYSRIISQVPYFFIPLALGEIRDHLYVPTKLRESLMTIFHTGYGTYVWATKQDHYNNSKAGHIAASEHH